MALTEEQRALLDLSRNRGLTEEEIAGLTGTDAEDVRERTRAALAALQEDPDGNAPARRLRSAPGLAIGVGLGCLVAGVLAISGAFSGDENAAPAPLAVPTDPGDQEVARYALSGTGGSGAQGSVVVGIDADNSPYLEIDLTGLEAAPAGGVHMLWIDIEGGRGLPLPDPIVVSGAGSAEDRVPLPLELAGIFELGRALEVVLADRKTLERVSRDVARAGERSRQGELDPSSLPRRPGTAVLRGRI